MLIKSVIVLLFAVNCLAKLPDDIKRCRYEDVECFKDMANDFMKKYPKGRTDLGLGQFDPYKFTNLSFAELNSPPVNLSLFCEEAELFGLSSIIFDKVVGFERDPTKSKFEWYGKIPKAVLNGKYDMNGMLILLPIIGKGDFSVDVFNITAALKFKTKVVERDGADYIEIEKIKIFMEPESLLIKMSNLFNGNKKLNDAMVDTLNESWREVWDQMLPSFLEIGETVVKNVVSGFFNKFSYSDLFLKNNE